MKVTAMFELVWLFFSVAAGMFAHYRRKRNGVGWFFAATLPPLVASSLSIGWLPANALLSIVAVFVLLAILPVQGPKLRKPSPPIDWSHAFGDLNTLHNLDKGAALVAMLIAATALMVTVIVMLAPSPV
jgi:hypothetical protein